MEETGRILALDYGKVRIGVAVSDELGLAAHGLRTIKRGEPEDDFREIQKLIEEYRAQRIIVGLPLTLKGELGDKGREVMGFVQALRERVPVPVDMWDERLSTAAAEKTLLHFDVSRRKRRKVADKVAAQIILQGYLDRLRHEKGRQ